MSAPDSPQYHDLGPFSDWVAEAQRQQTLYPTCPPGPETQAKVREVLGFCAGPEDPLDLRVDDTWESAGLAGEALSWSVGYGPRTQAWLLKPAGATGPLPGVVALHCHGGFKYVGKEKIARGPDEAPPYVRATWDWLYGGRPFANSLAREGFAVLVPDTFLWGSRRFPLETLPDWAPAALSGLPELRLAASWHPPGHRGIQLRGGPARARRREVLPSAGHDPGGRGQPRGPHQRERAARPAGRGPGPHRVHRPVRRRGTIRAAPGHA